MRSRTKYCYPNEYLGLTSTRYETTLRHYVIITGQVSYQFQI